MFPFAFRLNPDRTLNLPLSIPTPLKEELVSLFVQSIRNDIGRLQFV